MGCEQPASYYNDIYDKDPKYRGHYRDCPYYVLWQITLAMLKEIKDPQIVELGCGTGQFAHLLWDNGFCCYLGIDFSETAIGIAHGMSPQVFEVGDITKFKVEASNFNTVIILEVLEHLEKDRELLMGLPEGINIIFSVPNLEDPSHVRRFWSDKTINDRYGDLVDIERIEKLYDYRIVKGVIRGKNNLKSS